MIDTSLDELKMLEKNQINSPPTGKTTCRIHRIKMRFTFSGRLSEALGY